MTAIEQAIQTQYQTARYEVEVYPTHKAVRGTPMAVYTADSLEDAMGMADRGFCLVIERDTGVTIIVNAVVRGTASA